MKLSFKDIYGDIYLGKHLPIEKQEELAFPIRNSGCYIKRTHREEFYLSIPIRLYQDGTIKDDEFHYRFIDTCPLSSCSILVYHDFISYVPFVENYEVVQDIDCDSCLYLIEPLLI